MLVIISNNNSDHIPQTNHTKSNGHAINNNDISNSKDNNKEEEIRSHTCD